MRAARHLGWVCILFAVLTACGVPGIPKPPSLNLPQTVTDLKAVRKADRVYLSWSVPTRTTDSLPVRHRGQTQICRGLAPLTDCGNSVAEVAPVTISKDNATKPMQSYTDSLPSDIVRDDPSANIFYAISVLNENGRSAGLSNLVKVPGMASPPVLLDFQEQVTADGIVASWKEPPLGRGEHTYRIYRRAEDAARATVAGETRPGSTQFVDHSFEWEKSYSYWGTVVSRAPAEGNALREFEGDDTTAVKVFAHDVFPPAVPSGLQGVFSGAGQEPFIDLIWAANTDADLAGYNVYRREAGGEARKLNSSIITTPAFRDADIKSGQTYSYSVSAVDVRGNESERSAETGEAAP